MRIVTPVDLIVLNEKNQILLVRRAETEDADTGKWSIPGGGMEKGESQEQALRREIQEELNCEIRECKLFKTFDYSFSDKLVRATYFYGTINGTIQISEEHSEFGWFSFKEIPTLELAFNQKQVLLEFVKFYQKGK